MARLRVFWPLFALLLLGSLAVDDARGEEPAKQLSNDDLRSMLENMGYRFKEYKYSSGNLYFEVKTTIGSKEYFVKVSGGGGDQIWIVADLITLKPDQNVPAPIFQRMLETNTNATYVYYSLVPKSLELRIKGALPNSNLRPVVLREAIDEAAQFTANTTDLWWPDNWPGTLEKIAAEQAAAAPPAETSEKPAGDGLPIVGEAPATESAK